MTLLKQSLDNLLLGDFRSKSSFSAPPPPKKNMLSQFFPQKKRNFYLGNYKNNQPEIFRR